MNVTRIVAALVAVGFVAGSAMAQTKAAAAPAAGTEGGFLKQGTIEYGGSFGYSSVNVDQRTTSVGGNLSVLKAVAEADYFVIDNLSVGLAGNVDWVRGDLGGVPLVGGGIANATLMYGELVGRYHFPLCNDRIIPYVGATLGAGYGMATINLPGGAKIEADDTLTSYGVQAGFLVPLNANVSLDTCVKYTSYQLPRAWHTDLDSTQVLMGFKMKL